MAGPRLARYAGPVIRPVLLSLFLLPVAALAQVSVNPGALDQLKPAAPAATPAPASHAPARHAPERHTAPEHHTTPARTAHPAAPPAPVAKAKPKPVSVAPAPPPPAVLPPVVEVPHTAPPAPPPVPVLPDAEGQATPIPGGIRITFGAGKSDLNPATDAALQKLAAELKADPSVDINVYAYASGPQDDPSTPRRLSLSRALAARAVLISEGIASTRIYPRALGATVTNGPPERVDVSRAGSPVPDAKP